MTSRVTVWQQMWSGRGWRGVARRSLSAGVLGLLTGLTVAAPVAAVKANSEIERMTYMPSFTESAWSGTAGGEQAIVNRWYWLTSRGEVTGYDGPVWYVYSRAAEDSTWFYTEAEARAFAATVPGAVVEPSWEYSNPDDIEGGLLLEADGTPAIEIVASTGAVLYASPSVQAAEQVVGGPLTPATMPSYPLTGWSTQIGLAPEAQIGAVAGDDLVVTCTYEYGAEVLPYGRGVLVHVAPLPAESTFRVCGFRSTAMLARMRQVTWQRHLAVGGIAAGGTGVGAALLVGGIGAIAERVRRRAVKAAAADLPELVPATGPMAGLTDGVNVSLSRARAAVEQQRSFVADAAHELRSPLSTLLTTLEVAERYPHLTDQRSVTSTSLKQARRLERLTQDLLTLAQADARAPLRHDTIDVADLTSDVADDHRGQGPTIQVDRTDPASVVGDPDAVRRILANLVGNAVRHAQSRITLTVQSWPDRVDVIVADDGAGVPTSDRDRIFDRFTRLDDARGRDAGGSGLGLAIARDLARRHGGDVTLETPTPKDRGATFRLSLPTAR